MSDGQLHAISVAIGGLQASQLDRDKKFDAVFEKLDTIDNKLSALPAVALRVELLEDHHEDFDVRLRRLENRALWTQGFTAALAGVIASVGTVLFQTFIVPLVTG